MPLYLFEAPLLVDGQRDAIVRLSALRFPEVALERGFADHDGSRALWLCRAPSRERLWQWAAATGLRVRGIRHVEPLDLRPEVRTASKEHDHDHNR
jgi:hypothetical protein